MDLINFIKNLFKQKEELFKQNEELFRQKEDDLWVDPNVNSKSSIIISKCDNHILELNTLTGELIIKGNTRKYYPHKYWFPQNK